MKKLSVEQMAETYGGDCAFWAGVVTGVAVGVTILTSAGSATVPALAGATAFNAALIAAACSIYVKPLYP